MNLQYMGATGDNSLLPGTASGGQDAYITMIPGSSSSFGRLAVTELATVTASSEYRLTVAVGNRLDADPGNLTLSLTANGTVVASAFASASSLTEGTFSDITVSFQTAAFGDPNTGASLGVEFLMDVPGFGQQQLEGNFDNVRVFVTPVPEPIFTGAVAFTVLACFKYRRWRHAGSGLADAEPGAAADGGGRSAFPDV